MQNISTLHYPWVVNKLLNGVVVAEVSVVNFVFTVTMKIAAFNVKNLGMKKVNNDNILKNLIKVNHSRGAHCDLFDLLRVLIVFISFVLLNATWGYICLFVFKHSNPPLQSVPCSFFSYLTKISILSKC